MRLLFSQKSIAREGESEQVTVKTKKKNLVNPVYTVQKLTWRDAAGIRFATPIDVSRFSSKPRALERAKKLMRQSFGSRFIFFFFHLGSSVLSKELLSRLIKMSLMILSERLGRTSSSAD